MRADGPIVRAVGLGKTFGPVRALDDVSFELHRGEVVALAGENGSGKSTLAKILAGVHDPDSGHVELSGEAVRFAGPADAIDAGVALVAQEPTVLPHMTIAENVLLHRMRRPSAVVRSRRLVADAVPYLREVGLDVDPRLPFAALGQGQRELAEVAKALATEPQVLILDEATTRLPDPEQLFQVVERRCARSGMAAVIITHRLREIRRLSHRAVVLRDGRFVGTLDRHELSDERIAAMMVGRELGDFFAKTEQTVGDIVLDVAVLVTDRAPDAISLHVRRGEIVGVAGLIGSGRSELLETIAGCRRANGGAVVVAGRPLPNGSTRAAMRAGVSLVPEDRWAQGLIAHDPIVANLALSRHRALRRTDRRRDRRRARQAVADLGVRCSSIDAPVRTLSGGNAQKVVLARSLDSASRVLLLDEPTRGVDIGAKAEIYAIVNEMVGRGVGVMIASSDLLELLGLCDRIVVLHEGRVVGELDRDEATEERIALLSAGGTRVVDQ